MLVTEYGRALLVRAQRVQAEMEHARSDLSSLVDRGKVRTAPIFGMLTHERRIRAFVALTEQHHMPSVAESLGITQPAVSMAVRQMEDGIGTALFERSARGMIPTPAGAALALRLKRAQAEIRHAVADIAALRGITQGTVTVGALPLSRTRLLPESIAGLVGKYPGLRVATIEGSFETLAASLRSGDLDFILGALRPAEYASDLTGDALGDDALAIVSRSGHPWALQADPGARPPRALGTAPREHSEPVAVRARADHAGPAGAGRGGRDKRPGGAAWRPSEQSDLLTAISPRQLSYELAAGLLALLPIALPDTRRVIGITRRADSLAWPGAKLLMDEIVSRSPALLAVGQGAD
jgi:LysR family transcriptional regulator of gallate degradation